MVRVAARRGVPIVLMHNRAEPRYANVVAEVVADLQSAIGRALDAGVPWRG
jgi:dihydropteroate synthase